MELPDHVRHHVNVAVVAMILESRTGHSNRSSMYGSSVNKMWTMSDKLHEIIFSCLVSEESVLRETQLEVPNYYKFLRYFGNYEEEFQIIKEINTTPKNVLSESKWISNNNNRFNGTLKQWVYNTQLEIILDYLKFNNKELSEKLNNDKLDGELWNDLLQDFIVRMKKIYEMRKTLKLRFADHDDDTKLGNDGDDGGSGNVYGNGQVQGIQIKRKETNRFFKKLFKLPLKKKKKLINNQVRRDSSTIAIKYITNVPKSTSPFNDDANNDEDKNKLVMLKQILNSENISKDFITQVRK
ncbi:8466_t:CDS:2 [Entrophospora sp. SA101]|nr:3340_t:CDS:2 [Entrophospora sp. SA101]CAJ0648852.1 8466_t:CDS:2 [Entrophospora sp. SA101]